MNRPLWTNWSGSVSIRPARILTPRRLSEVVDIMTTADQRGIPVRVAGAGHSFTPLAATTGWLISTRRLIGCVRVDRDARTAIFRAGTTMAHASRILAAHGLALATMGTSRRTTLAGAICTGTHGSRIADAVMSTDLVAFQLVTPGGTALRCDAHTNPTIYHAGRISLGLLGVITELTVRCVPPFALGVTMATVPAEQVPDVAGATFETGGYFTTWWRPGARTAAIRHAQPVPALPVRPRPTDLLIDEMLKQNVLRRLAVTASRVRPALTPPLIARIENSSRSVPAVQAGPSVLAVAQPVPFVALEYAVPLADLAPVLSELDTALAAWFGHLPWPMEIRVSRADALPLSMAYQRDSAYLSLALPRHQIRHTPIIARTEHILRTRDGRPHLAKLHTMPTTALAATYPALTNLAEVHRTLDPRYHDQSVPAAPARSVVTAHLCPNGDLRTPIRVNCGEKVPRSVELYKPTGEYLVVAAGNTIVGRNRAAGRTTMSRYDPAVNVSRRTVIAGAAITAVAAATTGATATVSSAAASTTCASDANHICSGISLLATSTYDPPITATASQYSLHTEAPFTPGLVTTNPTLLLVNCQVNGTCKAACTGPLLDFTFNGTLRWSDGTVSAFHVDEVFTEFVAGHSVGHNRATISNGHFAGAQVDRLTLRLGDQLTACFTEGGVSTSTGAEIIVLSQP